MVRWEKKKSGYYRLIHLPNAEYWDEGIIAEVARGANGGWWMEYLDKERGWISNRYETFSRAKEVAMAHCKIS